MSVNIVYPNPVTDYTTAAAYFSYIENKIYNEQRLTKELYNMGVITESSSLYITEADGNGATNNLWQRFIAFLRSIANKFNESMTAFRKDNNGYLKKYEDIIKHRPLKGGPYTFDGDYTLGMQRINALNTNIKNVDFDQDYAKYKDQLTSDNDFDFASAIAEGLKVQNNEDLNTALKNYFLGADADKHTFTADKIKLPQIYNTCVDKNDRIGNFDKVIDTVDKTQPKITTNNNSSNNNGNNNKNQPKRQKKNNNTPQSSTNTNNTQAGTNDQNKNILYYARHPVEAKQKAQEKHQEIKNNRQQKNQDSSYIDYDVFSYFNEAKKFNINDIKKEIDDLYSDMDKELKNAEKSEKEIKDNKIDPNKLAGYTAFSTDKNNIKKYKDRLKSIKDSNDYANVPDNDLTMMHTHLENFKNSIDALNSQIKTEKSKNPPNSKDPKQLTTKMQQDVIRKIQEIENAVDKTKLTQDQQKALEDMQKRIKKFTQNDASAYYKVYKQNITDDKTLNILSGNINTLKNELRQLENTLKVKNPDTDGSTSSTSINIGSLATIISQNINKANDLIDRYNKVCKPDAIRQKKRQDINEDAFNMYNELNDAVEIIRYYNLDKNGQKAILQELIKIQNRATGGKTELDEINKAANTLKNDNIYSVVTSALDNIEKPQSTSDQSQTGQEQNNQGTGDDEEEETTEDKQQDDQTNEEQNKALRKWTTIMTSIYSASCTAYEKIVKDYMELLRMHVRSYAGEKQENNNTVNIGG